MEYWTAILTVLVALVIYLYYSAKRNYFAQHGIPHITPLPIFGNSANVLFQRIPIIRYIQNVYNLNAEAKYVGHFDFGCPTVIIRDPELIKNIAIKSFDHFVNHRQVVDPELEPLFGKNLFSLNDDKWRSSRAILSPAFTSSKMKAMFKLMSECADNFTNYLVEQSREKPLVIDSKDAFCRYTNDVIATCAFGVSVNSMKDPNNDFFILGKKFGTFSGSILFKFLLVRSFPTLTKLLNFRILDREVGEFFLALVKDTIRMREEKGISRPDMIQLMMETNRNAAGGEGTLSIEDMTSHAFTFFLGGFDSTSTNLCFAAHEIAANRNVQEKLQNEIDELFENCNGDITYDAVNKLEYLDAVVNETLRIHPVGAFADRICTKSFELPPTLPGKEPLQLKPGDYIWIPIFALQRDRKYFSDPDTFNPDRFIEDPRGTLNSPAYFPFGVGPRICIGNRFALLETKVVLVHLIAKCKLKIADKMVTPLEYCKNGIMTAKGGFWLEIEPRET